MTNGRRRPSRALLTVAASVVALSLPAPSGAHSVLRSATPSSGSTVGALTHVELDFTTPVQSRLAQVVVEDLRGTDHVVGPVASFDSQVTVQVSDLRAGRYTVAYRVVAADGHPLVGSYRFQVAAGAAASASSPADVAAPGSTTPDPGRPWLVPLLGVLAVAGAVLLRVAHGVRRVAR